MIRSPIAFERLVACRRPVPPRHGWRMCLLIATSLFVAAGAGCGYRHAMLYPAGIATVNVPIFQNRTFYQGVEFDLTEAVIKEIESRTPYKTASAGGDTILQGTIVRISQHQLSRTAEGGLPQEIEVRVVVDIEWKDQRDGKILRERRGMIGVGRFVPTRAIGEPFPVAQHEAVQRLAAQIVATMRAGL